MGQTLSHHDLELAKNEAIAFEASIAHPKHSHISYASGDTQFAEHFLHEVQNQIAHIDQVLLKVQQHLPPAKKPSPVAQLLIVPDPYVGMLQVCLQYFQSHELDKASNLASRLMKHYETKGPTDPGKLPILAKIVSEQNLIDYYYSVIHSKNWHFRGETDGVKVSSRMEEDDESIGVLIESPLNVPIEIFVAVVTQIDLFCRFVPFMKYSKEEKTVSRNAKIGHVINDLPFISKRQAFFLGVGYDRLEHNNTVMLYTRSFGDDMQLQKELNYYAKKTPGAVQLNYKYFAMEYTPESLNKGMIKLALNVDMKLRAVPNFILDWASRKFGFEFITNIVNISKKFEGSDWKTGVEKDPSLFNFFRGRLKEYIVNVKSLK